jgi:hypothetical protein
LLYDYIDVSEISEGYIMKIRFPVLVIVLTLTLVTSACGFNLQTAPTPDIGATAQMVAQTLQVVAAHQTEQLKVIPTETDTPLPTATVPSQTPVVITATFAPTATVTQTPPPTLTPTPAITNTPNPALLMSQLEARIKAANVLIYDEPDIHGRLVGRIQSATDGFGFSGGTVINTHDLIGRFDTLLRSRKWDLVILAVESRDRIELGTLGLLDTIPKYLSEGGALIVETWNLDEDQSALARVFLDACGAHVEKDWRRGDEPWVPDFALNAIMPGSPVFNTPNLINLPMWPTYFWTDDIGDLIRIDNPNQSWILAGLDRHTPNNYGLLTSCLNGRMILQTFSSHDYSLYDNARLWQNMIHYTLMNHFYSQ